MSSTDSNPTSDQTAPASASAEQEQAVTPDAPVDQAQAPAASEEPQTPAAETPADHEQSAAPDAAAAPVSEEPVPVEVPAPAAEEPAPAAEEPAPAAEEPAPAAEGTAPAAVPTPAAVAAPTPGPVPVPAPPKAKVTTAAAQTAAAWGRVAEDGTVEVREGDAWRVVGQYPDGTSDEALAYFVRKYDDLAFKVAALEQRQIAGGATASELVKQAEHLRGELTDAAAVGDLAALAGRLDTLTASLSEATAREAKEAKEAVDAAIAERTGIVEQIEAIAAKDLARVQWKQVTADVGALFDAWQAHQQNGPRLPKSASQQLWKRFRDARATVDRARRAFYAELDETHKSAKAAKQRLIERAEALAPNGADGIPAYRNLLDEWKASGRAGRKADDALWARFKAAGDVLYGARAEQSAADEAESAPKIEARTAMLEEAKAVADERDIKRARALLTQIQRRWEEVGRIFPRERERALDDQLRAVEVALKKREDVDWKKNNPETKARAGDMSRQLNDAIEKLEQELAAAEQSGDAKAVKAASEALEARRAWLTALGG